MNLSLLIFRKGFVGVAGNGIHFIDDSARSGFHQLSSILPVDFVAVVVRWIVARRENDSGSGAEMTNRKTQLRRGSGLRENIDITAVLSGHFGDTVRKLFSEMS